MKKFNCPHCGKELNGTELLAIDGVKAFFDYHTVMYVLATYITFCDDCHEFVYTEKEIPLDLEEIAKGEIKC